MAYVEIAHIADIEEGTGKKIEKDGKTIALFKKNGEIFALEDTCAHAGGPLSEGTLDNDCVTCPWHGFEYNLKTGKSVQGCEVHTYPVKIENQKVLIDI